MIKPEVLQQFPPRRLKPIDGMAVTADVWEEAHDYHRLQQRYHALFGHGPGILAGLEVIASNPPDASVYVLPGVAVDARGDIIVVKEPTAYQLGTNMEGRLYLYLSFGESRPMAMGPGDQGEQPLFVRAEFGLEALTTPPPLPSPAARAASSPAGGGSSMIELARVLRTDRKAAVSDAADALHPGPNMLDLRFRLERATTEVRAAQIGLCQLGGSDRRHERGADMMAREVRRGDGLRAWVDGMKLLDPESAGCSLLYLVAHRQFELSRDEMNALYAYLRGAGTVLMESCRQETGPGDAPADASFLDLLASLGIPLREVTMGHPLLDGPNFFAGPPTGFETDCPPHVLVGEGVVFSGADYGCLWQGERRGRTATREEIRAAHEFGANIVAYALDRRADRAVGA